VKHYWLLPSFLSVFLLSLPASAGKLVFWRFDTNQNRLAFTTDSGVQPRAILISNPTRLIIDLPGTSLGRATVKQPLSGTMNFFRVGQLDNRTTRLVLELKPGYTLDPQQVIFRGASPRNWSVQLPRPQRIEELPNLISPPQSTPRLNQTNQTMPKTLAQLLEMSIPKLSNKS
jgi:N-acetylmuramoyl-L-alanine amidase